MLPMSFMVLLEDENNKVLYKKIYREHRHILVAYAYTLLNDSSLAEDALSETFFRLAKCFQKIQNFKVSEIVSYAVIIIRNVCFDMIRAEEKQQAIIEAAADYEAEAESIAKDDIKELLIESAVMALPEIYRDAVIMRYFYDFRIAEIAEQLGLSTSGVKKRIATGLRMLRKEFTDD